MKIPFVLPAAAALALGSATVALTPASVLAQQPSPPPAAVPQQPAPPQHPAPPPRAQRPARGFASHIEGRIAFLKAELKITPAQEAAFDKVAQAMRENAADLQKSFQARRAERGQAHSAVDRLNEMLQMAQLRVRDGQRYLAAFKPLYDSLSPDQKQAADRMLAPRRFMHRPMGQRPGVRPPT